MSISALFWVPKNIILKFSFKENSSKDFQWVSAFLSLSGLGRLCPVAHGRSDLIYFSLSTNSGCLMYIQRNLGTFLSVRRLTLFLHLLLTYLHWENLWSGLHTVILVEKQYCQGSGYVSSMQRSSLQQKSLSHLSSFWCQCQQNSIGPGFL